jgi:hypothetical protein
MKKLTRVLVVPEYTMYGSSASTTTTRTISPAVHRSGLRDRVTRTPSTPVPTTERSVTSLIPSPAE